MVLRIIFDDTPFLLFNFYHNVADSANSLTHLFHASEDVTPALLARDFNTHSPLWSLPGAEISSWAPCLTDWMIQAGWSLFSPPGIITRRGQEDQRDSVLNLLLLNNACIFHDFISLPTVSFPASCGSDHAALSFTISLPLLDVGNKALPNGFIVNDALKLNWVSTFRNIHRPLPTSIPELQTAADLLASDIDSVSEGLFDRK